MNAEKWSWKRRLSVERARLSNWTGVEELLGLAPNKPSYNTSPPLFKRKKENWAGAARATEILHFGRNIFR